MVNDFLIKCSNFLRIELIKVSPAGVFSDGGVFFKHCLFHWCVKLKPQALWGCNKTLYCQNDSSILFEIIRHSTSFAFNFFKILFHLITLAGIRRKKLFLATDCELPPVEICCKEPKKNLQCFTRHWKTIDAGNRLHGNNILSQILLTSWNSLAKIGSAHWVSLKWLMNLKYIKFLCSD